MRDETATRLEYRLNWMAAPSAEVGRPLGLDDPVGAWIASCDAEAVRRYVASREWPAGTAMTLSIADTAAPLRPLSSVTCGAREILAWSPADAALPAADATLSPPPSRRTAALALMRDLSSAMDGAVAAGLLVRDEADALLLLARNAMDKRRPASPAR